MLIYDKADKDIEEVFELLLSRYQTGFEESIKGSDIFFYGCVNFFFYKCHKINLKRGYFFLDIKQASKNR